MCGSSRGCQGCLTGWCSLRCSVPGLLQCGAGCRQKSCSGNCQGIFLPSLPCETHCISRKPGALCPDGEISSQNWQRQGMAVSCLTDGWYIPGCLLWVPHCKAIKPILGCKATGCLGCQVWDKIFTCWVVLGGNFCAPSLLRTCPLGQHSSHCTETQLLWLGLPRSFASSKNKCWQGKEGGRYESVRWHYIRTFSWCSPAQFRKYWVSWVSWLCLYQWCSGSSPDSFQEGSPSCGTGRRWRIGAETQVGQLW